MIEVVICVCALHPSLRLHLLLRVSVAPMIECGSVSD